MMGKMKYDPVPHPKENPSATPRDSTPGGIYVGGSIFVGQAPWRLTTPEGRTAS